MEKDFEKASIRKIAEASGTSKSNIYNYFKNKDDLFCSVLMPTMNTVNKAIQHKNGEYADGIKQEYNLESQKKIIEIIMSYVFQNKDDFILLLFKSGGSSYESFRDKIKYLYTDIMLNWLSISYPDKDISRFFVEAVADFYINTISQLINKEITMVEIEQYFNEFLFFVYGGWNRILRDGERYE